MKPLADVQKRFTEGSRRLTEEPQKVHGGFTKAHRGDTIGSRRINKRLIGCLYKAHEQQIKHEIVKEKTENLFFSAASSQNNKSKFIDFVLNHACSEALPFSRKDGPAAW